MKTILLLLITVALLSSCDQIENKHRSYVNGAVVTTEHYIDGYFVQVDTSRDGVADVRAQIVGNTGKVRFRGDSVSVDIRSIKNFATPLMK